MTPPHETLTRCPSCDGYGWITDDFTDETTDCDWCAGAGYVYRNADGVDRPIPAAEYGQVEAELERLENERLREMGYSGTAKHPSEQEVRQPRQDEEE